MRVCTRMCHTSGLAVWEMAGGQLLQEQRGWRKEGEKVSRGRSDVPALTFPFKHGEGGWV